jgi:hypothetical protein
MKYVKHPDGEEGFTEWFLPKENGWRMRCCDCRLVHDFQFKYVRGQGIVMRARRNERATGASRGGKP